MSRQLELFPTRKARARAATSPVTPRTPAEARLVNRLEAAASPKRARYSSAAIRRLMTPLPRITVPGWPK